MTQLKIYAVCGVAIVTILGLAGKCLYDLGYEACHEEWIAANNKAKDDAQVASKESYEALQKELAEAYERGVVAGYDQRLQQYGDMQASRGMETSCHDRDAILKLAIDSEKALAEAIEFLRAERKR